MRSQFTFYKSFDDVIEDMTDKQIVEYVKSLLDVQFLRKRISEISFDDKLLSMVWKSQKHSITSSIDGYLNSQKKEGVTNPYFGAYATPSEGGFFTPSNDPYEGGRQQEEEKGKEEVKVKGKEKGKGERAISPITHENLPIDYKFIQSFIDNRKKLKKPMTEHAIELFIKSVIKHHEDGYDVIKLIEKAIVGGWQSLYPKDEDKLQQAPKGAFGDKVSNNMHVFDDFLKRRENERVQDA